MRRAIGGVAFLVATLVGSGGVARGQQQPGSVEGDEAEDDGGEAWEEPEEGGREALSRPHFDGDEDEEDEGGGARIVEVPAAPSAPVRVITPAPVVTPAAKAVAPSLGSASRAPLSTTTAVRAPGGAAANGDEEYDPYADHPVRAYLGASGLGTFVLRQQSGREALQAGGGVSVFAGVDLGAWVGLELGYTGSFHSPGLACADNFSPGTCGGNYLVMDLVSVDLRMHLPTGTRLVPYIQAGGLLGWLGRDNRMPAASGAGFEAGGGIEGWVGDYVTLGTKVLYRGVQVSEATVAHGLQSSFVHLLTTSVDLGIHF